MNIHKLLAVGTPETLIEAVINTLENFEDNAHETWGLKAGSDEWLYNLSHYRPILLNSIREHWAAITDMQPHRCPFNEDTLIHMWVCVRKNVYTIDRLREDLKTRRNASSLFPECSAV